MIALHSRPCATRRRSTKCCLVSRCLRYRAVRPQTGSRAAAARALTGVFLVSYFCARFVIEFWKEPEGIDPASLLNIGQLLSIPFIVAGAVLLWRSLRHARSAGWIVGRKDNRPRSYVSAAGLRRAKSPQSKSKQRLPAGQLRSPRRFRQTRGYNPPLSPALQFGGDPADDVPTPRLRSEQQCPCQRGLHQVAELIRFGRFRPFHDLRASGLHTLRGHDPAAIAFKRLVHVN